MVDQFDIVARAKSDLQRAEAAAQRARESLARAESEVADLRAFLRTYQRYSPESGTANVGEHVVNTRSPARSSSRGSDMVDVCIGAILGAGRPVMIGDLLDEVLAAGFTLGGQDQKSNLAGYLSRDPRVYSVGRNVGWDVVRSVAASSEVTSSGDSPDIQPPHYDEKTAAALRDIDDLLR